MNTDVLGRLAATWRTEADALERRGAYGQAVTLRSTAEELETTLTEWQIEALTLNAAAQESGYSAGHLGRLVRDGKLANVGGRNAPRVRRGDLPIKPPALPSPDREDEVSSVRQAVRSIVEQG